MNRLRFDNPPQVPLWDARYEWLPDNNAILDTSLATITSVNAAAGYPKIGSQGGRAALLVKTAGAATDGANIQFGVTTAPLILAARTASAYGPQVGRRTTRFEFSIRSDANFSTLGLFAGFAAVDTSIIASAPTDYIGLLKVTGDTTSPKYVARKASGTAESALVGGFPSFASAAWYDVAMDFDNGASAGLGNLKIWAKKDGDPGADLDLVANIAIATQFPDTVALLPSLAIFNGSAGTPEVAISRLAWGHSL